MALGIACLLAARSQPRLRARFLTLSPQLHLTIDAHASIPRIEFFNDATYGPYSGSIISVSGGPTSPSNPDALNEREQEILQLLARGARNKEIAAQLFLSIKTVEYHLAHLFTKLGVSNRTEAARVATERGLVAPEGRGLK